MSQLELSADGAHATYRTNAPRENVFVMSSDGTDRRRLTDDAFRNRGPRWIRGDWVIFYSNRSGSYQLWLMRQDGTELRRLTDFAGIEVQDPVVSPDGKQVAMGLRTADASPRLVVANVEDAWFTPGKPPPPIAVKPIADAFDPRDWSPDGATLGGITFTAHGPVAATCDLATGRVTPRESFRAWNLFGIAWLPDGRRFLSWDFTRNATLLQDLDGRNAKEVPGVPGPCELKVSPDGRTLMVARTILDGDIWLLTLR